MKRENFQKVCEQSGFRLLGKRPTKFGYILLAERLTKHPAYPQKYWETIWSIERDDCDVAQVVRNDLFATKNGVFRAITVQDRVQDAKNAAILWIRDNVKSGRYTR